jgi:outer membrane protein assembly factor BamE (lipoprotein component of BamABCDE complex)
LPETGHGAIYPLKESRMWADNPAMHRSVSIPRAFSLLACVLAMGLAAICWLSRRAVAEQMRVRSMDQLRRAIIGNDKAAIAAVLGPPRASAGFESIAPAVLVASDSFYADTWYYLLDRAARQALVVQFDCGIARDAQLLRTPVKQITNRC